MRLDHLSFAATPDGLARTAQRIGELLGTEFVDGGVHPRFGTRNMILPLGGGTYLEVGHISPNSIARLDVQKLVSNQVRFNAIQHYDPWIIPNAIDFLMRTREKYQLTKVISHAFPIEQIDEAFTTAEWLGREAGSVVTRAIVTP